jgi:hypothetical protein
LFPDKELSMDKMEKRQPDVLTWMDDLADGLAKVFLPEPKPMQQKSKPFARRGACKGKRTQA